MIKAPSLLEEVSPIATVPAAIATEATIADQPPFTPKEWKAFRSEDRQAARAVVIILTACYTLGLLMALGVLLCCL